MTLFTWGNETEYQVHKNHKPKNVRNTCSTLDMCASVCDKVKMCNISRKMCHE